MPKIVSNKLQSTITIVGKLNRLVEWSRIANQTFPNYYSTVPL